MLKRTIITIACLFVLYVVGAFHIPNGRVRTFLYTFDSEWRARDYKRYDAYDYAREKCIHLDMTKEGDKCWDTAYNEFMAR
jgi:hypothetical protein